MRWKSNLIPAQLEMQVVSYMTQFWGDTKFARIHHSNLFLINRQVKIMLQFLKDL